MLSCPSNPSIVWPSAILNQPDMDYIVNEPLRLARLDTSPLSSICKKKKHSLIFFHLQRVRFEGVSSKKTPSKVHIPSRCLSISLWYFFLHIELAREEERFYQFLMIGGGIGEVLISETCINSSISGAR